MRSIHATLWALARGLRGMVQAPVLQLVAVATIAVCMLLFGTVLLVWTNVRNVTHAWGLDVPITVTMKDDATTAELERLVWLSSSVDDVAVVEVVSPDDALARLRDGLGGDADLVAGIDAEILPTTIEIRLREGADDPARADALAETLAGQPGVEDVASVGAWAERARTLLETLGDLAIFAALLVGLACTAVVGGTIRLGVHARRAEIQILQLVGGTRRFVHGPFLVEGLLQGTLGAAVAAGLLWVGFSWARPLVESGLSLLFAAGALHFLAPLEIVALIAFGASVGVLGSRAAVGRYVEG